MSLPDSLVRSQTIPRIAISNLMMDFDPFQLHRPVPWYADFVPITPGLRLNQVPHQAFDPVVLASILCSTCESLGAWAEYQMLKERWHEHDDSFEHHQTGSALLRSSKDGCHMCTLIWQSFVRRHPDFKPPAHGLAPNWLRESGGILVKWSWTSDSAGSSDFRIRVFAKIPSTSSRCPEDQFALFRVIVPSWKSSPDTEANPETIPNAAGTTTKTRSSESSLLKPLEPGATTNRNFPLRPFSYMLGHKIQYGNTPTNNDTTNRYLEGECLRLLHRPTDVTRTSTNSKSQPSYINSIYTNSQSFSKYWDSLFQECLNFHQCSGSVSSAMPTRLVDIGSAAESVPPRLVDTESELISAPYATLSYCWGGTNQLQLTESSLEEFKLQIPASQLSFTILDAVHVVRQLKLRYLWVDSLCIIQDSKSDWAKEVITMGEVFRNSAITISALGAKHSKEGLFARRDPLIYLPCNLFQRDGRDFFVTSHVSDSQFSDDWFEKGPLHQRGWVMQERALSPRTLNFGATVVWECSKGVKYEHGTGFELETSFTDSPDNSTIKSKLHEPLKVEVTPDQSRFLLNFWKEKILKPYTMTILTVKEDRLAAISGVIDLIGKSSGWESVYGLWKPFLAEELLWHKFIFVPWRGDWRHQNNKEKLGQSRLGIAPTWSWASLDIKIDFDFSVGEPPVRLFTAQVTVVSNAPIASMIKASPWNSKIIVRSKLYPSGFAVKGRSELFCFLVDQASFQGSILFDIVPSAPPPYYYLPLIVEHFPDWYHAGDEGKVRFAGIVLVKSTDIPGAYERVGYSHPYVPRVVADNLLQNELISVELV